MSSTILGVTWAAVGSALVFLAVLVVLTVDRNRLKRRLYRAESGQALLATDLHAARSEIATLRELIGIDGDFAGRPLGR